MLYEQINKNKQKTFVLIFVFFILLSAIGAFIGYGIMDNILIGVILALVIACIYTMIMLSNSKKIVMKLNGARKVEQHEYPILWATVENMAMVARIPMPEVYIVETDALNAFASGSSPEKAAVAVTSGLLAILSNEELEGVIAHEVAHIRNYDIRLSTIAIALTSVILLMANILTPRGRTRSENGGELIVKLILMVVFAVLVPLTATILQLALSRNREYLADSTAVELCRNPNGLSKALQKITNGPELETASKTSAMLYIASPKKVERMKQKSLFSTHPPVEDRISRLSKM